MLTLDSIAIGDTIIHPVTGEAYTADRRLTSDVLSAVHADGHTVTLFAEDVLGRSAIYSAPWTRADTGEPRAA